MASKSNICLTHFSFFIFLIYCVITFKLVTCQTPLINSICRRTMSVDFCKQSLMSTPSSLTANLHGLGLITNNLIRGNVTKTIHEIEDFLAHEQSDTEQWHTLTVCHPAYFYLQLHISLMSNHWEKKEFMNAYAEARKGIDKVDNCDNAIRGGESPLSANNVIIRQLFVMVIIMCDTAQTVPNQQKRIPFKRRV